jgi:hypothetical protein
MKWIDRIVDDWDRFFGGWVVEDIEENIIDHFERWIITGDYSIRNDTDDMEVHVYNGKIHSKNYHREWGMTRPQAAIIRRAVKKSLGLDL